MFLSGIQKLTLLDYPGKVACTVFTPGCNFRCGFCHNQEFVSPAEIKKIASSFIPAEKFFKFLKTRQGLLDGVVICGGEPTLQTDLMDFIQKIKALGFLVKLDTNGYLFPILKEIINNKLVDYIAMDLKTSLADYPRVVDTNLDIEEIRKSIELIKNSFIKYEFRTTIIQELHSKNILTDMANLLTGAKKYCLQKFIPRKTLNPRFQNYHPFTAEEVIPIIKLFKKNIEVVEYRD
jgi:pyruvate formate lyase activating enzyme